MRQRALQKAAMKAATGKKVSPTMLPTMAVVDHGTLEESLANRLWSLMDCLKETLRISETAWDAMRAAGLTAELEETLLVRMSQATNKFSGWSSVRKAFKQFPFSRAQVAPPDDDDFVEESDNEIAPCGEPSDNTMWSEPDVLAFFMNGDTQSGLKQILRQGSQADEQGSTELGSTSQRTWLTFLTLGTLDPNLQIKQHEQTKLLARGSLVAPRYDVGLVRVESAAKGRRALRVQCREGCCCHCRDNGERHLRTDWHAPFEDPPSNISVAMMPSQRRFHSEEIPLDNCLRAFVARTLAPIVEWHEGSRVPIVEFYSGVRGRGRYRNAWASSG